MPKKLGLGDTCRAGHLLTPDTTYTEGTRLRCLTCLRSRKPLKEREEKTHCPQGHPYDDENTYVDAKGYKQCRTCRNDRMTERRQNLPRVGRGINNSAKTHCPQGHEYTPENTLTAKGWKNGKRRVCRECQRKHMRKVVIQNYGITLERYQEMLSAQDNCCIICDSEFIENPHIDHDHSCCPGKRSCGKCVRGLLCGVCNRMLGLADDNPEILRAAAMYLDRWQL